VIILITIVVAASLSMPAQAHKPIIEERETHGYGDAILIPDPDVSWAIYGFLKTHDSVDYYYFDAKDSMNLYTELLVPKNAIYANFHPSYVIVGPGIDAVPSGLPFNMPSGMGAIIVDGDNGDGIFYEPFTAITYYRGDQRHTPIKPGRYYIVVFDKSRNHGDYVLAVGEKESFGLGDMPGVIAAVIKIRSGGVDHSAQISSGK
jgi:hypothetical protein